MHGSSMDDNWRERAAAGMISYWNLMRNCSDLDKDMGSGDGSYSPFSWWFFGGGDSGLKGTDTLLSVISPDGLSHEDIPVIMDAVSEVWRSAASLDPFSKQLDQLTVLRHLSRLALRLGAMSLASKCIPSLLALCRDVGCPHNISIASGLACEWMMGKGAWKNAHRYALESVHYGSEQQRIAGYLAMIHSADGAVVQARTLGESALAVQVRLLGKQSTRVFGHLILMRVLAIQESLNPGSLNPLELRFHMRAIQELLDHAPDNRVTRSAWCQACLLVGCLDLEPIESGFSYRHPVDELGYLASIGRWRDVLLCPQFANPCLLNRATALRDAFDKLQLDGMPQPWIMDQWEIDQLSDIPVSMIPALFVSV